MHDQLVQQEVFLNWPQEVLVAGFFDLKNPFRGSCFRSSWIFRQQEKHDILVVIHLRSLVCSAQHASRQSYLGTALPKQLY